MKISVITVCFNAAAEIEATMLSVLEQTHPDVEYIVVDGGSTDGTAEIIARHAPRLAWWVSEPDGGIYDAMNKGLARATGAYVNFMNAGDRFASPDALATAAAALALHRPTILYGNTRMRERGVVYEIPGRAPEELMARRMPFCHQSVLVSTDYHKAHPFDTSFRCCADYNMFYKAFFTDKVDFRHVDSLIADYNEGEGFSRSNMSTTYREVYRVWGIENNRLKVAAMEMKLLWRRLMIALRYAMPARLLRIYRS